jgi:hypothetical protein
MRPRTAAPFFSRSWLIALLIGLAFVGLELTLRFEIAGSDPADQHPALDLTLLLCGYLFMFCLKPIQKTVHHRLCRRSAGKPAR